MKKGDQSAPDRYRQNGNEILGTIFLLLFSPDPNCYFLCFYKTISSYQWVLFSQKIWRLLGKKGSVILIVIVLFRRNVGDNFWQNCIQSAILRERGWRLMTTTISCSWIFSLIGRKKRGSIIVVASFCTHVSHVDFPRNNNEKEFKIYIKYKNLSAI